MVQLRPYQSELVAKIRTSFAKNKRTVAVLPTGGGKTITFCHIAQAALAKGKRVMFLVHKKDLVRQISETLTNFGIRHGKIAGGSPKQYYLQAQVAGVQALANRLDEVPAPDIIIVDECHHAPASTWRQILAHYSEAYVLGVTATPCRSDGQGLGDIFGDMVLGPAVRDLIGMGFLVEPEIYAPVSSKLDFSQVPISMGDYDKNEAIRVMDEACIFGDAIDLYRKFADGVPAIAFCYSIAKAEELAEKFRAAGYASEAVHGELQESEIKRILGGLGDGSIQVVTSCDLISEGTDVPAVGCVIMLRRTQSESLYLQMVGRGLRPCEGKERCIVLDMVKNTYNGIDGLHDAPTIEREWSLESARKIGRRSEGGEVTERYYTCHNCSRLYVLAEHKCCPKCGTAPDLKVRYIKHQEAEFARIHVEMIERLKKEARKEQGRERSLEGLWEIAQAQGRKIGWIKYVFIGKVQKYIKMNKCTVSEVNAHFGINTASLKDEDVQRACIAAFNSFASAVRAGGIL
jgi:DNA repair protein RadD